MLVESCEDQTGMLLVSARNSGFRGEGPLGSWFQWFRVEGLGWKRPGGLGFSGLGIQGIYGTSAGKARFLRVAG